jgi:hypothetical protein
MLGHRRVSSELLATIIHNSTSITKILPLIVRLPGGSACRDTSFQDNSFLGFSCFRIFQRCFPTLKPRPPPPPRPPDSDAVQESVKVFIEEVRIPIIAQDEYGRLDPTLSINDLMLRENGDLHQLKSVYGIPASVLLLLDTGGEQNPVKNVRLTRSTAQALVAGLQPDDQIAVMQVSNRVELLHDWTTSHAELMKTLDDKLLPGKRVALVKGLAEAVNHFKSRLPAIVI